MNKKIILLFSASFLTFMLESCSTTQFQQSSSTISSSVMTTGAKPTLISDDSIWKADTQTTWHKLQHTPLTTLETAQTNDAYMGGWIKLAIISKRFSENTTELVSHLIDWRQQYPNHPGNQLFPNNETLTNLQNQTPKKIALLLPLQGQYGPSGRAVREGFLGSYYRALTKNQPIPNISFYDTSTADVTSLYHKAINEGADMVVGPLLKEQVQVITKQSNFPIPTLTLNYTNSWFGSLPNNLYQFGLSPNDEAQQIADKARQTGVSRAILIAPQTDWGKNVVKTLIDKWQSLGGSIIDTYYFTPQSNLAQDIPRLLHINPTEDQNKMKTNNNRQELQKQRRHDFDSIFLLAPPITARQIVPLLRFYYVENVPIYSTSIVYSGTPSPQKDNDLDGIIFCDMPWTLQTTGKMSSNRLYAVGRDAYLLSLQLNRVIQLPNFPIYGATGSLTLTPDHQIYRRLAWAKFHEGHP